jgi:hypothetical protein
MVAINGAGISTTATAAPVITNPANPTQFAEAILEGLGAPLTANNEQTLVAWWEREGGAGPQFGVANNDDNYNPFNTTLAEPGAVSTNSAGVKSYTSWDQGIAATLSTLEEPAYASIVADLRANAPEATTAAAVGKSPWGTPDFDPSGTTSVNGGSASAPPSTSATLTSFPGGRLDPLNWPSEVLKDGGGAIASGGLGIISAITAPLTHFLEDSTLVILGIVIFIVGVVLIAHSRSNSGAGASAAPAAASGGLATEAEEGAEVAAG